MREVAPLRSGRRAPEPPRPFATELVRSRLVELATRRFSVPVTVVVAGAGFGKSTLLAQAIRANVAEPRGRDAWVSCEPGDGDAEHLAAALLTALGGAGPRRDHVDAVLDALGRHAPVDVCVVIDDVHEVPERSPGADLLAELVARLPPHAHVLLAGRRRPPVRLARRQAAGEVVEIRVDDLAFTADEVTAFGGLDDRYQRAAPQLGHLGGWPSLVTLAMSAPSDAAPQFLWEEIVAGLDPEQRQQLLALATLGWGTAADVARVAGTGTADIHALAAAVPLIRSDTGDRFAIHELWQAAVGAIFPAADQRLARRRALALYRARGDTRRAGWSALHWGDAAALRLAARRLVGDTLGALPIDTAERWLAGARGAAGGTPELQLLELAVRQARRHDDRQLVDDALAVADRFHTAGDVAATVTALAFAAVVAHSIGDEARLSIIVGRVQPLASVASGPVPRFLAGLCTVALASLRGEVDAALAAIGALSFDHVPTPITEFAVRLHTAKLCLAGRADEAVAVSAALADSPSAYVRTVPPYIRWIAGDASVYTAGSLDTDPAPGTNARWRLYHSTWMTMVAASLGDSAAVTKVRPTIEALAAGEPDSRDRAIIAVATAARQIAEHDEAAAARTIAAHVDAHPATDRLGDVHLRWILPIPYVCDARLRDRWDDLPTRPSHARHQAVADALLAARAGEIDRSWRLPDPQVVITALPLPWSVELAARAAVAGSPVGRTLAAGLVDHAGAAVTDELHYAVEHGDAAVRRGAAKLLAALPDPSQPALRIGVLGEFEVYVGDKLLERADVRGRVRTVLELLSLAGPLRREQLIELMWPELDGVAAGRNLRVTLSRVRSVLDTGRRPSACPVLHVAGDTVALGAPPCVDVDLWQFRADVAEASAAERDGDPARQVRALERAAGRWRGEPFADLVGISSVSAELAAVRSAMAATTLELGELYLVGGRFDDAAACAERVLRGSPHDERAHRLAIAAHLQRGDADAVAGAVASTRAALDALDVDPEPATRMVLNQAGARAT